MTTIYQEGMTQAQEDFARSILEVVTFAYPGHPWSVRVFGDGSGGRFFIQHLAFTGKWGINSPYMPVLCADLALKKMVIRMAGEWLERANMKRGRYDSEQEYYRVEGVPEKYQPPQLRKPQNVELAPDTLREVPRPQALMADTEKTTNG